uniref:Uncharacterized protein n=1 Tax=Peronospora matthiolae TaxID=2874970 RepID=A0AAV1TNI9_9STRA
MPIAVLILRESPASTTTAAEGGRSDQVVLSTAQRAVLDVAPLLP